MKKTIHALTAFANKAEHIIHDDTIIELPDNKYAERHMFYLEETGEHLVMLTVFDTYTDTIHYWESEIFKTRGQADQYYNSLLGLLEGKVFHYGAA